MKRLWVRLSLSFSVIIILGVVAVLVTVILNRTPSDKADFTDSRQVSGEIVEQLAASYRARQDWDEVGTILAQWDDRLSPERFRPVTFLVADESGQIIYDPRGETDGEQLESWQKRDSSAIIVDDQIAGYLVISFDLAALDDTLETVALRRLREQIVIVAIGGSLIGILFGGWISRSLTSPLNRLAAGARAIRDGNFDQRVDVHGSTEITEVANAFNEMAEALAEAETLRSNLVADVAHELRTPLSVLQSNLYAILDDVYPFDRAQAARLYDQTRVLSRLVNDLHELSQAEARQLPLDIKSVDLRPIVEDTVSNFELVAESKDVSINVDISEDLPEIPVDMERINQVLHNLISNAFRHSPSGSSITVRAVPDDRYVRLSVKDSGDGIPPEHVKHIFERFYRANPARDRAAGGAGLGLAIAKEIVHLHGGQMEVDSEGVPGKGATFSVWLPAER